MAGLCKKVWTESLDTHLRKSGHTLILSAASGLRKKTFFLMHKLTVYWLFLRIVA